MSRSIVLTGPSGRRARSAPAAGRGSRAWLRCLPLAIVLLVAFVGPLFLPYSSTAIVGPPLQPPSAAHWFGLDSNGMDVFSRVIDASRTNLLIAATATAAATLTGIVLGALAGMNEHRRGPVGWLARGAFRVLDVMDAIPAVISGLVVVALLGPTLATIVLVVAVVSFPRQAKLVRAEVLKVRSEGFVDSARMSGFREIEVAFRTVLPNSVGPALENVSPVFGVSIIVVAALGFLGVGMPPPTPEWGTMIASGASDALGLRWWTAAFPTLALVLSVWSVALASTVLFRRRS